MCCTLVLCVVRREAAGRRTAPAWTCVWLDCTWPSKWWVLATPLRGARVASGGADRHQVEPRALERRQWARRRRRRRAWRCGVDSLGAGIAEESCCEKRRELRGQLEDRSAAVGEECRTCPQRRIELECDASHWHRRCCCWCVVASAALASPQEKVTYGHLPNVALDAWRTWTQAEAPKRRRRERLE